MCLRLYKRGRVLLALLVIACMTLQNAVANPEPFRIGTGGSAGTYFPIGSLIAGAITDKGDLRQPANYRVPDLLALAQRSNGSVVNVSEISTGMLEAGLAQADVIHWAYNASGPFKDRKPMRNLRTVATLYFESVHLVARTGSQINSIRDLVDKRVSLDEVGSGTLIDTEAIINAFGLSASNMQAVYLKPVDAIERLRKDELDAFFIIAGYPVAAVSELVSDGLAMVIPIDGAELDEGFSARFPMFTKDRIPEGTYQNKSAIPTLAVAAQLAVNGNLPDQLIYGLTGMLWSEHTKQLLTQGHPKGKEIELDTALLGIVVPLHEGAQRFYREQGLLNGNSNDN